MMTMKPAIVNGKPEKGENCSSIDISAPASAAVAKPSAKLIALHAVDVDADDVRLPRAARSRRASPGRRRCG